MNLKTLSSLGFLVGLAACQPAAPVEREAPAETRASRAPAEPIQAALIAADGTPAGRVTMRHGPQGALFTIEGENWPQGWHGTHVHAAGRCDPPTFESAAGHLNNQGDAHPHGLLNFDGGPDFGDLQNVYASADGTARAEVYLASQGMDGHDMSGPGLSLIVHAGPDDHLSQPIGGAGDRIACAVLIPEGQPAPD